MKQKSAKVAEENVVALFFPIRFAIFRMEEKSFRVTHKLVAVCFLCFYFCGSIHPARLCHRKSSMPFCN